MSCALNRLLKTLRADRRGAAIIEFAMVAAPFITLMLAIFQTTLVYFSQEGLQTTAEAASRLVLTGQAQQAGMTSAQFKSAVCNKLPPFLDCSKLMIDVRKASSFSAIGTSTPSITLDANGNPTNSWSYQPGVGGEIVILRLMYLWPISTTPMGIGIGDVSPTKRLLIATTVARSEFYK